MGAVIAGVAADSAAFWAGASVVFYTALAAVIAFAANELGVVAKTASLLRAALKSEAPVDAESERGEEVAHHDDVAFELGQRLETEGQLVAAEYAYRLAGDHHADALYALGCLLDVRDELPDADRSLLLAAGWGHAPAAYQLGVLHGRHGRELSVPYKVWADEEDNVVAGYVLGREEGELSSRDARVLLVVGEEEYELDWSEARELVQRLLDGPRYEASERLAPTISRALEDQTGERIVLDDDDVHAVSHVLRWPDPQPDSQLFALRTALEGVAEAWRERDADE